MSLDLLVLVVYGLAMLSLGWVGMRRSKSQEDFLVAGRALGPTRYMSTMAATVLGGASTIGSVRLGYVYGISGFWPCAAIGAGIVLLNLFLAGPLIRLRVFTVTQVLERRYTPLTRRISAVIMFAYALMIGVVSTLGISTILQVFLHLPLTVAVLCSGGIVIIYSTLGGMWALTLTDIVQFVIKTIGLLCILLPVALHRAGGWDALVAQLPPSALSPTAIGYDTIITYILLYTFGVMIGQDIWQRVFTARSPRVAQVAGTAAGLYCVLYGLATAVIGMCAHVLLPNLPDVNNAFAAVIQFALPDGLRSLIIAAAVAAMMSTASAGLLAASSTLSEDLLPVVRGGRESDMKVIRWCTLITGVFVLSVALLVTDVLTALTLAYDLLVGGMFVPLIGAIFWKRATPRAAVVSMTAGCLTSFGFMVKDGIAANSPLYYSLAVASLSFAVISLLSRPAAAGVVADGSINAAP